jgi:hypothetical protein
MSREAGEAAPLAPQAEDTQLPERLLTILNGAGGPDPKTGAIRILRAPFKSLLAPLRIVAEDIGVTDETVALDDAMLRKIVEITGGNVIQIDLRSDPPGITGKKPFRIYYENMAIPVFVITDEGPGILVLNPAAPELLRKSDMPVGLFTAIEKVLTASRGVLKMKGKVPAPAAAPVPAPEPVKEELPPPPPAQPADAPPPSLEPPRPVDLV